MNAAFVKRYNCKKSRRVFKNLTRVLAKETLDEALDEIKREERGNYIAIMNMEETHQYSDLARNYVFDHHRTAIGFIKMCGFKSLVDGIVVPETHLAERFRASERQIADAIMHLRLEFEIRNFQYRDVKYIPDVANSIYVGKVLRLINKVLLGMYDVKVTNDRVDREMYKIKYSGLFPLIPTDDRPYIQIERDDKPYKVEKL